MGEIAELTTRIRQFVVERDWEQFNTPKNLAMALTGEVGEVVEHLQWLTQEQSNHLPEETRQALALELADVFVYLLRLADRLNVDLVATTLHKIELNERRYPAAEVRGKAGKRP